MKASKHDARIQKLLILVWFSLGSAPPLASGQVVDQASDPMLSLLQQRIDQNPEHADSWRLMGKLRQQRGQSDEALQAFEQALQLDPESVAAHFDIGKLWLQIGQSSNADLHFAQVMELSPTSSYANTLAEEGLAKLPTDRVDDLRDVMPEIENSVQPASYQIQTFDGADDLEQRVNQLASDAMPKPRRIRAFIEGGVLYNTNVSLTPTSRELRGIHAASAQGFLNPDIEYVVFDRQGTRFGPLTRGYFNVNSNDLRAFNLASFQGGAFAERDLLWGDRIMIGRTEYVYVLDLLDATRFGDRHTVTSSLTALQPDGGLYYLYGAASFAQFANDGINPTTDSLDGNTYTTGLSRIFRTRWSRLTNWSLGGDLESANTEGADYRYRSWAIHTDSTLVVTSRWSLIPEAGVGYRNYYAFTGTVNRNEVIWRAALRSRLQLTKGLSISGVASFDRFASDNASFDADRAQVGLVTTYLY